MAEAVRVLFNGAKGRMGRALVPRLGVAEGIELVAATDVDDDLGRALQRSEAQVAVDFTTAEAARRSVATMISMGVRPVVGTTGLSEEDLAGFSEACRKRSLGGVVAPNFSVGAALMMRFAAEAARYLPEAEIVEMHHAGKLDSPSGTALRTAARIAETRGSTPPSAELAPARGLAVRGVPVHAIRLPGVLAHQTVYLAAEAELLRIHHDTLGREAFLPGVLLAIRRVMSLERLVLGLETLLFERG